MPPRRVSRHTGAYSESALWIPLFQFLQLLITLVKHTGSTSFYDCPDLLTGWDVVTSRLHLLQHLARSQVRDIPDWCSSGAFYFKFLLEPYIICWRVDIEVRVATQPWVWCDFLLLPQEGGRNMADTQEKVSTMQSNLYLHFNYQICSCEGRTAVLDMWILLCTVEKLVLRDYPSWKHVGCLFYSTFYRIRKHDLHRAYKCAQCEGFARYSWQACTPRLFSQQACWWVQLQILQQHLFLWATTVRDVRILLGSAEKLEPRDYSFWQHVVSHLYFHRLALSDYWRDFGTSFCMWYYQASGKNPWCWLQSSCSTMSWRPILVSVEKPRQVLLPSASVGSVCQCCHSQGCHCWSRTANVPQMIFQAVFVVWPIWAHISIATGSCVRITTLVQPPASRV